MENLRMIARDKGLSALLAIAAVPSTDAFGQWLQRMGARGTGLSALGGVIDRVLAVLGKKLRKRRKKAGLPPVREVTLDLDATQVAEKAFRLIVVRRWVQNLFAGGGNGSAILRYPLQGFGHEPQRDSLAGPREGTVKLDPRRDAMKPFWRVVNLKAWGNLNFSNRPVRTRMPDGVGGDRFVRAAPIPIPENRTNFFSS